MKQPILIANRHPCIRISHRYLKRKTSEILSLLQLGNASLELTLCDDKFMKAANKRFMKKAGTTDVLSFPHIAAKKISAFKGQYLGDILVSLDQAKKQAQVQGITLTREVLFLVVHSVLHLIGHDHAEKGERLKMQALESKIWKALHA